MEIKTRTLTYVALADIVGEKLAAEVRECLSDYTDTTWTGLNGAFMTVYRLCGGLQDVQGAVVAGDGHMDAEDAAADETARRALAALEASGLPRETMIELGY